MPAPSAGSCRRARRRRSTPKLREAARPSPESIGRSSDQSVQQIDANRSKSSPASGRTRHNGIRRKGDHLTAALCPGSFDPPTNGHLDVINRAIEVFDRVVVGVVHNPSKTPFFSAEERVAMLDEMVGGRAEVQAFEGSAGRLCPGQGCRRRRQGPAGHQRLRLRTADGADELHPGRDGDPLHPDQPAVELSLVIPGSGSRSSRRRCRYAWCPTTLPRPFEPRWPNTCRSESAFSMRPMMSDDSPRFSRSREHRRLRIDRGADRRGPGSQVGAAVRQCPPRPRLLIEQLQKLQGRSPGRAAGRHGGWSANARRSSPAPTRGPAR